MTDRIEYDAMASFRAAKADADRRKREEADAWFAQNSADRRSEALRALGLEPEWGA